MFMVEKLRKSFFNRSAELVAKELLGKTLVRVIDGKELKGKIVETEAYYGSHDPASRARQNGDLKKTMEMEPGTILVYGVHNNWLINFVNEKLGCAQAVLIRAIEPINFNKKGNGPGLLTRAMKIDKKFHKENICNCEEIYLFDDYSDFEIVKTHRIGVKKDLIKPLRFYIKDSIYISKK
jgi:DNA-3-methyladenine glycosylase